MTNNKLKAAQHKLYIEQNAVECQDSRKKLLEETQAANAKFEAWKKEMEEAEKMEPFSW